MNTEQWSNAHSWMTWFKLYIFFNTHTHTHAKRHVVCLFRLLGHNDLQCNVPGNTSRAVSVCLCGFSVILQLMTSYGTLPTDDGPSNLEQQTSTPTRTRAEWRRGLGEALENEKVHWTILGLTVLDALCVLFQIIYTFFHECQTDHAPTHWMRGLVELAEIISMCITCLFLLEMLLAFIAFGPRYYLPGWEHWKMHILDVVGMFFPLVAMADFFG